MISVLITTYNPEGTSIRTDPLIRVVNEIRLQLEQWVEYEIVISDDCSSQSHIDAINQIKPDKLVRQYERSGLGRNSNQGFQACEGRYILNVQDDFLPIGEFGLALASSIEFMDKNQDIDMMRFVCGRSVDFFGPVERRGDYNVCKYYDGFSKSLYSDTPHLRRPEFHDKFGWYPEGGNVGHAENGMVRQCIEFGITVAFPVDPGGKKITQSMFTHIGGHDENGNVIAINHTEHDLRG